ncbi:MULTISPECIES: ABC transporter ATP-binding protein [unclassified Lysinibacillus]|uniref:ABC transporter ATP-binding protein n=1 Tax=unclassified Lysinibacillus TaxID=2636778 RepID=UPI00116B2E3B|nr:ABC transporter ATP-binding protein [Lysinibacillus sp. CD3-6]QPQ36414.1 ABC transporter ATP-binding protein [Lysinibacillus sp. JNUCC-52]UED81865.1 ABC transporter ATP-binding protein [Lysinibacillus sp. CD3-6]
MKLEIKGVTKNFKTKTAVHNFSMVVDTGQCVGLIGPNGAGKSTLIKIIADILYADKGEVLLDGKKISNMKREVGYLPQYPDFFHWMTAKETLFFMGQLSGITKEKLIEEVPAILTKVGLINEQNEKVQTFSGGMKQRLGIAQTLLHKPSFIVMDEPVSALDPIGRREVLNLIQEIKHETTILLSTHILGDAEEICERFVIMKQGEKIMDTTIDKLLTHNSEEVVHLEIASENMLSVQIIEKLPYVKHVEANGKRMKVTLENVQENKDMLMRDTLENKLDIVRFEVGSSETLEDIFLKMVVSV